MNLLISLLLYGSTVLLGYLIGASFQLKSFWERLGVGWLLGSAGLTYGFFILYDLFGFRFTALNTVILISALITIFFGLNRIKGLTIDYFITEVRNRLLQLWKLHTNSVTLFLVFLIFVPLSFTFLQNVHWPVMDWDALALYDFRAKVFTQTGGMEDGISRGYFLHYPLYTSLLHTFSYLFGIQSARTWYTLFYSFSLMTFYGLLRRQVSRNQALAASFFLTISPRIFQHTQMTYTNLPHAMFLALGYIYLWYWWRKGARYDLVIGALLIAASTWVRLTEPLWIPALVIIGMGAIKWKQFLPSLLSMGVIVALRYPWTSFVSYYDHLSITNPLQIGNGLQLPQNPFVFIARSMEVTQFFFSSVIPLFKEYIPALIVAFIYLLYRENWKDLEEYWFFGFLLLFIYAGIYLFSFQFLGWRDIPDSAARMSMFLLPLAIYLIGKSELWLPPNKKQ